MIVATLSAGALRAEAKRLRQARIAEGATLTLPSTGATVSVDTERDDISALSAEVIRDKDGDVTYPSFWKGGGAFYVLANAADLRAVALAAGARVRTAYNAEQAATAAINSGAATTRAAVAAAFAAAL